MVWVDIQKYENSPSPNGMEVYDTLFELDGFKLAVDIADNLRYTFFKTTRRELVKQINELVLSNRE